MVSSFFPDFPYEIEVKLNLPKVTRNFHFRTFTVPTDTPRGSSLSLSISLWALVLVVLILFLICWILSWFWYSYFCLNYSLYASIRFIRSLSSHRFFSSIYFLRIYSRCFASISSLWWIYSKVIGGPILLLCCYSEL